MNIHTFDHYGQMSAHAAKIIMDELAQKKDLELCTATGNSPTGTYQLLADAFVDDPKLFEGLHVLKLDEWGGLPADHPSSCERYLQEQLLHPLKISNDRYTGFVPNPKDPEAECARIQKLIEKKEEIDLCILGLGKNGHIGFNEPADALQPFCHVAELSEESKAHGMVSELPQRPKYGMTLGMQNILSAKRIILLICGNGKKEATAMLLKGKITPQFPVTFLWLHPNVDCLWVKEN
ncbi:galactosamine-6-phosphate isomerase [Flagellimonas baculiformis]|uniref:galactosamine-6-phosphate isomerase n=1 Tax=Flagellimonas baculiformis TaxID=3067310 RepID=UPI00296F98CE|nr:galactosamine-6-phosphate isomerase [Muricauda sp. D6]